MNDGLRSISRRQLLVGTAATATTFAVGGSLAGCSGYKPPPTGGTGSSLVGGAVTWSSPGNPGEAALLRKYSTDYQAKVGTKVTWQQTVGDYQSKLLTQLAGGSAPDAFYVFDTQMVKMIETGKLMDLSAYLAGPDAVVKQEEFFPKLTKWMAPPRR